MTTIGRQEIKRLAGRIESSYVSGGDPLTDIGAAVVLLKEYADTIPVCPTCGGDGKCQTCEGSGEEPTPLVCTGCDPLCAILFGDTHPGKTCNYCDRPHEGVDTGPGTC